MDRVTYDVIEDQLRAIYRAVTGSDAPAEGGPPSEEAQVSEAELERRFADVEATVRAVPVIAERIPPYAFTPPIDVIDDGQSLVVELGLPGVEEDDLQVSVDEGLLVVTGVRRGGQAANGRNYLHAEIPRGPFRRIVPLPAPVAGEPEVVVRQGVVCITLPKRPEAGAPEHETKARRTGRSHHKP
jgi:HSP20 family protein